MDICWVLDVDPSFVQKVRRELQASGMDYEVTVTQKETIRSADHHQMDNFVTKVQKRLKMIQPSQ